MSTVAWLVLIGSILLVVHSLFSLYVMLYAWARPNPPSVGRMPEAFLSPQLSFTVLIPARHEELVIRKTIRNVASAHYPPKLLEIVVICTDDDVGTIAEAQAAARDAASQGLAPVRVEIFSTGPINKPHGLNVGLQRSRNAIVTVFDAEDDISPDIFNIVNTLMLADGCKIVQAGVQLMNFDDHWFCIHSVLEYFFHFRSRLLYFARIGMVPLGGNTVFVSRDLIERVGGWDERCLTEDADIGVRLSATGERVHVVYDPRHATQEETPPTVASLVRQRTRWHQGFLQVLRKGQWRQLREWRQRFLAIYIFSYPIVQALFTMAWPVALAGWMWLKLPLTVALISWLPMYVLVCQLVATLVGIRIFGREYNRKVPWTLLPRAIAGFLPFHLLMGFSAMRALYRELRRASNWEKTHHVGAHRAADSPDRRVDPRGVGEPSRLSTEE